MATARLIVGASEHCADLLYATRFFAPDDVIWFFFKKRSYAYFSPLEMDRARREAHLDRILPLFPLEQKLKRALKRPPRQEEIVLEILKRHRIRRVEVSQAFPLALADFLRKQKIQVRACDGEFFPERQFKNEREIRAITHAQRIAEAGLARGIEILRAASIGKNGALRWGQGKLTSEILRGEIDALIVRLGGLPSRTIVAGGRQACDPHEVGHGPLKARTAIILDIFPRDQNTGYFGDLSRTVVKGKASLALKHLYQTVLEGQRLALRSIKPGVHGKQLHEVIVKFFEKNDYKTQKKNGRWVGFFHGTGHCLGLEIHEPPRFANAIFQIGHVTTVEPGLYYPSIGGVRLEDVVVVRSRGIQNLTCAPKYLEL